MKYKNMDNREINEAVALRRGLTLCPDEKQKPGPIILTEEHYLLKGTVPQVDYKAWDYCHLVDHAWPIIQEIWWELFEVGDCGVVKWNQYSTFDEDHDGRLRAAMIIYLESMVKRG